LSINLARGKGYYKLAGKVIAWSLIHGGPAGNFFSNSLYNAISFTGNCRLTYFEDIADDELREKVAQVCLDTFLIRY
jgi:hypothetical protein